MHHEHHGDCCAPLEPHVQEHQDHLVLPLGQMCCAGACNHTEHQLIQDQMHMPQLVTEQNAAVGKEFTKKKKKSKRKQLGSFSLAALAGAA